MSRKWLRISADVLIEFFKRGPHGTRVIREALPEDVGIIDVAWRNGDVELLLESSEYKDGEPLYAESPVYEDTT